MKETTKTVSNICSEVFDIMFDSFCIYCAIVNYRGNSLFYSCIFGVVATYSLSRHVAKRGFGIKFE